MTDEQQQTGKRPLMARLRRYLITGVVIWIPLGVTIFVIQFFVSNMDQLITLFPESWQPSHLVGFNIPGLGVILAVIILLFTGFLASNYLGRVLLTLGNELLEHIPLVRSIYMTAKQISDTMFSNTGRSFRKVVLIRYPNKETWSLAFQTGESLGELNAKLPEHMVSVFVPTTPNPTSGFLLMVPQDDMIELEMTVDEALKMIISLGVIVPPWPRPHKPGDTTGGDTVPELADPHR